MIPKTNRETKLSSEHPLNTVPPTSRFVHSYNVTILYEQLCSPSFFFSWPVNLHATYTIYNDA